METGEGSGEGGRRREEEGGMGRSEGGDGRGEGEEGDGRSEGRPDVGEERAGWGGRASLPFPKRLGPARRVSWLPPDVIGPSSRAGSPRL